MGPFSVSLFTLYAPSRRILRSFPSFFFCLFLSFSSPRVQSRAQGRVKRLPDCFFRGPVFFSAPACCVLLFPTFLLFSLDAGLLSFDLVVAAVFVFLFGAFFGVLGVFLYCLFWGGWCFFGVGEVWVFFGFCVCFVLVFFCFVWGLGFSGWVLVGVVFFFFLFLFFFFSFLILLLPSVQAVGA